VRFFRAAQPQIVDAGYVLNGAKKYLISLV
jgi:hypothetical protein